MAVARERDLSNSYAGGDVGVAFSEWSDDPGSAILVEGPLTEEDELTWSCDFSAGGDVVDPVSP